MFRSAKSDLKTYFKGKKVDFSHYKIDLSKYSLPTQKVLKEVRKIPYGETITYKELAKRIGRPRSYRAVANSLKANKAPIIIPCHRVVSVSSLGGYKYGLKIKERLLRLEGAIKEEIRDKS